MHMKVIVPVDFSDFSVNAAEFAAQMIQGRFGHTLILYHVYQDESEFVLANGNLEWLKGKFALKYEVHIENRIEQGDDLINCLTRIIRSEEVDLVVMTVTDRSKIVAESFSLQMIAQSICPVLVIPPGFTYKQVKNVALACDFKKVQQMIPIVPVKKILQILRPSLYIVNVNSKADPERDEMILEQKEALEDIFAEYRPEFHFLTTTGFHESLRQFIADKKIDLVLTFPRKHSFFTYLLKGANTRKLVYEAEVPVLAAHE